MVDIRFIKTDKCPICGNSLIVDESVEVEFNSDKIRQHCNGGRWETRRFSCGLEIRYSPNFIREERYGRCRKDLSMKERDEKRSSALFNILEKVDGLDCDDEFKNNLKNKLT